LRRGVTAATVLVAGLLAVPTASAVTITEFPSDGAQSVAIGPDGKLWSTAGPRVGRMGMSGADFTHFPAGPGGLLVNATGITAGPDGNVWFTETFGGNKIGRITTDGAIVEFPVGTADPVAIATGADGNLWFTDFANRRIGRITPDGATIDYFPPAGTLAGNPSRITSGPDGALWFTEFGSKKIGRITQSGAITEYPAVGTLAGDPIGITTGPDGNLWFADIGARKIGRISTDGATIVEYPVPRSGARVNGIAVGPDGNLWFTDVDAHVGRMTLAGVVDEFPLGGAAEPAGITAGPDGNMWFSPGRPGPGNIARATTDSPAPSSGNLLRNPSFEDGLPAVAPAPVPVPGWALIPNATVATYAGLFVPPPASGGAGNQLMWGGPFNTQSAVIQQVDVSAQAAGIDAGRGEITLSALLGGGGAEQDDAVVIATFLSATDGDLGATAIGPVTAADRGNATRLLPRSIVAGVPAGTRAIRVEGRLVRQLGPTNDGLVDDVSLTLNVAPAPGAGGSEPPGGGTPGGGTPGGGSPGPGGAIDRAPSTTIDVPARTALRDGKLRKLTGTARDDKRVARVDVSVVRTGRTCSQLTAAGRFKRLESAGCTPTTFLPAKGTTTWTLKLPTALPAGSYVVYARATDSAGKRGTSRRSLRLRSAKK
jgi:streptogramin lyase